MANSPIALIILGLGILMVRKANIVLQEQGKYEYMNTKSDLHAVSVTNNQIKIKNKTNNETNNLNISKNETKTNTNNVKQIKNVKEDTNEQK